MKEGCLSEEIIRLYDKCHWLPPQFNAGDKYIYYEHTLWDMAGESNGHGERNPNRRSILRRMSGAAVGASGIGALSGNASAHPPDIKRIDGREAEQAIGIAKRSSEFRLLRKSLKDEYNLVPNQPNTVLKTVSSSGTTSLIVSFDLYWRGNPQRDADYDADLAVQLKDGSVNNARATITRYDNQQRPDHVVVFSVTDGSVTKDEQSVDNPNLSLESEAISDDVSTEFFHGTSECSACKSLYHAACAIGCGVGLSALCIAAGISTVAGGVACAAIASSVCYIIGKYGCDIDAKVGCRMEGHCG